MANRPWGAGMRCFRARAGSDGSYGSHATTPATCPPPDARLGGARAAGDPVVAGWTANLSKCEASGAHPRRVRASDHPTIASSEARAWLGGHLRPHTWTNGLSMTVQPATPRFPAALAPPRRASGGGQVAGVVAWDP